MGLFLWVKKSVNGIRVLSAIDGAASVYLSYFWVKKSVKSLFIRFLKLLRYLLWPTKFTNLLSENIQITII
ncbi:hypothetical protein PRUPE_1G080400 [Prunus persica]|uniref:Uncharacterized protein n=1 Tax=Prunus persica TaxID=3760 RepID=M5WJS4_PRUPE|nr:hypothetical protein PRUPE_1G080400 [Prunus persica]